MGICRVQGELRVMRQILNTSMGSTNEYSDLAHELTF